MYIISTHPYIKAVRWTNHLPHQNTTKKVAKPNKVYIIGAILKQISFKSKFHITINRSQTMCVTFEVY